MSKHKNREHYTLALRSVRSNKTKNKIVYYTPKDVDFIVGYCPENNSCYIFPSSDLKIKHEIHIWIEKEPKGKNQFKPIDTKIYKNNWNLLNQ